MAEYNYFEDLKAGLEDVIAWQKGDKSRARSVVRELPVPEYKAPDVARVRSALNLSQRGLALVLGVSSRTVEAWEVGRNVPNGAARNLLYLIDHNHSLADNLLVR